MEDIHGLPRPNAAGCRKFHALCGDRFCLLPSSFNCYVRLSRGGTFLAGYLLSKRLQEESHENSKIRIDVRSATRFRHSPGHGGGSRAGIAAPGRETNGPDRGSLSISCVGTLVMPEIRLTRSRGASRKSQACLAVVFPALPFALAARRTASILRRHWPTWSMDAAWLRSPPQPVCLCGFGNLLRKFSSLRSRGCLTASCSATRSVTIFRVQQYCRRFGYSSLPTLPRVCMSKRPCGPQISSFESHRVTACFRCRSLGCGVVLHNAWNARTLAHHPSMDERYGYRVSVALRPF